VYNRGSELVNKDNSTIFFSENCLDETKLVVRDRLDKKVGSYSCAPTSKVLARPPPPQWWRAPPSTSMCTSAARTPPPQLYTQPRAQPGPSPPQPVQPAHNPKRPCSCTGLHSTTVGSHAVITASLATTGPTGHRDEEDFKLCWLFVKKMLTFLHKMLVPLFWRKDGSNFFSKEMLVQLLSIFQ
jgi:hypothetical protein